MVLEFLLNPDRMQALIAMITKAADETPYGQVTPIPPGAYGSGAPLAVQLDYHTQRVQQAIEDDLRQVMQTLGLSAEALQTMVFGGLEADEQTIEAMAPLRQTLTALYPEAASDQEEEVGA